MESPLLLSMDIRRTLLIFKYILHLYSVKPYIVLQDLTTQLLNIVNQNIITASELYVTLDTINCYYISSKLPDSIDKNT